MSQEYLPIVTRFGQPPIYIYLNSLSESQEMINGSPLLNQIGTYFGTLTGSGVEPKLNLQRSRNIFFLLHLLATKNSLVPESHSIFLAICSPSLTCPGSTFSTDLQGLANWLCVAWSWVGSTRIRAIP